MFNQGDNIAFNEAEQHADRPVFFPSKKEIRKLVNKADTYGPESVYAKKSCFFLANKTAHITKEL